MGEGTPSLPLLLIRLLEMEVERVLEVRARLRLAAAASRSLCCCRLDTVAGVLRFDGVDKDGEMVLSDRGEPADWLARLSARFVDGEDL